MLDIIIALEVYNYIFQKIKRKFNFFSKPANIHHTFFYKKKKNLLTFWIKINILPVNEYYVA